MAKSVIPTMMNRAIRHLRKIGKALSSAPRYPWVIALQVLSGLTSFAGLPLFIPVLEIMDAKGTAHTLPPIPGLPQHVLAFFGVKEEFIPLMLLIAGLSALGFLMNFGANLLAQLEQYRVYQKCSRRLFGAYLDVNWNWLTEHHTGEVSHALYIEAANWSATVFQSLNLCTTAIQAATYFALALYLSWKATLFAGVALSCILCTNIFNSLQIKKIVFKKNEDQKRYSSFLNSVQQNRKFIKSSLIHLPLISQFNNLLGAMVEGANRVAYREQSQQLWTQMGVFSLFLFLMLFHAPLGISASELMVLLLVFLRLAPQLNALTQGYSSFSQVLPLYDSIETRISDLEKNSEATGSNPFVEGCDIKIRNLEFRYRSESPVLQSINLDIPSRSTVGLVGASGSGKSTLLDLILGLRKPASGEILYGSVHHDDLDIASFRRRVAYVSQETTLMDGTLSSNLILANPQATPDEVEEVCKQVHLEELIQSLPLGLETPIGENGVQLSGGQRQRLALARALLMKPAVLILDEATSALDLESERVIRDTVKNLRKNMTILIVAHRLSTVREADTIYVLENGQICESGSYEELMQKQGRLYYLDSLQ